MPLKIIGNKTSCCNSFGIVSAETFLTGRCVVTLQMQMNIGGGSTQKASQTLNPIVSEVLMSIRIVNTSQDQ